MIAIIGAGISGLSAAYHLQKKGIDYQLFERNDKVGGVIQTMAKEGRLLELGPNSLLCDTKTLHFFKELGLADELLPAADVNKNRFIFKNGTYQKLPSSPPSLLFNSFFDWKTKFRIFKERNITTRSFEGETVHSFFERRFGEKVTQWAVNPFIAGIYAGDPKALLIEKTFPKMVELETEYGSVIKGMIKSKSDTARKATYSFKNGLDTLPKKLASQLTGLVKNAPIKHIKPIENGWELVMEEKVVHASKVIIATPPLTACHLLKPYFPEEAQALEAINQPPMVVVHTSFRRADVKHSLDGFGGLNPKIENRFAAGSIWSSSIFPNRAPEKEVLFTNFVGGEQYVQHTHLQDGEIITNVVNELRQAYGIIGDPQLTHLYRWTHAIPQYDRNILSPLEKMALLEKKNLFVCANWKGGVSVISCIEKGKQIADRLTHD